MTGTKPKGRNTHQPTNKHFEDRIFDRDTLILREFSINLLFVIAAYAGYEDECWTIEIHKKIRDAFIESIDAEYEFYIVTPAQITPLQFLHLYIDKLNGKVYTLDESDDHLIVAFEKSPTGTADKEDFITSRLYSNDTGEEIKYEFIPTSLRELSQKK